MQNTDDIMNGLFNGRKTVEDQDRERRERMIALERAMILNSEVYQRELKCADEHMQKLLGIAAEGQVAERALKADSNDSALRSSSDKPIDDYRVWSFNAMRKPKYKKPDEGNDDDPTTLQPEAG